MRKQIAFLLSFMCIALGAFAQSEGGFTQRRTTPRQNGNGSGRNITVNQKSYGFEFSLGPRVGIGLGIMSDGKLDGGNKLKVADGVGFGFDAGLGMNVRFGGKDSKGRPLNGQGLFGIGLELNYAYTSLPTIGDKSLNLGYFEVPLLFQFYPAFQTKQLKNLYLEIGPTFSALVNKSPADLQLDPLTIYHTGGLKGGDIKGTIGLGYRFNRSAANDGFYMNFRYNIGFSKLAGNFPSKVSTAELTFGYFFKCVGGKKKGQSTPTPKPINKNILR